MKELLNWIMHTPFYSSQNYWLLNIAEISPNFDLYIEMLLTFCWGFQCLEFAVGRLRRRVLHHGREAAAAHDDRPGVPRLDPAEVPVVLRRFVGRLVQHLSATSSKKEEKKRKQMNVYRRKIEKVILNKTR